MVGWQALGRTGEGGLGKWEGGEAALVSCLGSGQVWVGAWQGWAT